MLMLVSQTIFYRFDLTHTRIALLRCVMCMCNFTQPNSIDLSKTYAICNLLVANC